MLCSIHAGERGKEMGIIWFCVRVHARCVSVCVCARTHCVCVSVWGKGEILRCLGQRGWCLSDKSFMLFWCTSAQTCHLTWRERHTICRSHTSQELQAAF